MEMPPPKRRHSIASNEGRTHGQEHHPHPQCFLTAPLANWIQNNPSIIPPELLFQEGAPMIYPMCGVECRKRSLDCPSMTTCSIKGGRGDGGVIR